MQVLPPPESGPLEPECLLARHLPTFKLPNQEALELTLEQANHREYTTVIMPGANHLFQKAVTGSPTEYAQLDREFLPGFLDLITNWILEDVLKG